MIRPHDQWTSAEIAQHVRASRTLGHPPSKPRRDWSWVLPFVVIVGVSVVATIIVNDTLRAVFDPCGPC